MCGLRQRHLSTCFPQEGKGRPLTHTPEIEPRRPSGGQEAQRRRSCVAVGPGVVAPERLSGVWRQRLLLAARHATILSSRRAGAWLLVSHWPREAKC